MIYGLTFLWYSGYTNSMIKIEHIKHYKHRMRSNKLEYITAVGPYCTTHDAKVPFCMS